jgi:hypothetical protein
MPEPRILEPRHRHANAYWQPKQILIYGQHRTRAGFHISAEPWLSLPADADPPIVGEMVQRALASYRVDVPTPDWRSPEWKTLRASFHRAAGVRSEREFQLKGRLVQITWDDGRLDVCPTHNGGTKGDEKGFRNLRSIEATIEPPQGHAAIGVAIRDAWARCT